MLNNCIDSWSLPSFLFGHSVYFLANLSGQIQRRIIINDFVHKTQYCLFPYFLQCLTIIFGCSEDNLHELSKKVREKFKALLQLAN